MPVITPDIQLMNLLGQAKALETDAYNLLTSETCTAEDVQKAERIQADAETLKSRASSLSLMSNPLWSVDQSLDSVSGLTDEQQLRLTDVLDRWLSALEQGTPLAQQKLLADHPDLAPTLQKYFHSLADLHEMAGSSLISTSGKLRMALDLVLPRGAAGADESLESFVVRRLGREVFDRLAQPLVGGIYGADPALLSLRATMPRFVELEASHRSVILGLRARQRAALERTAGKASGARYGLFAAFRHGMQVLVDALVKQLDGAVETHSLVTAICLLYTSDAADE